MAASPQGDLGFRFGEGDYSYEKIQERLEEENDEQLDIAWLSNPASAFMEKKDYQRIIEESASAHTQKYYGTGKIITVDTRDQSGCESFKEQLLRNTMIDQSKVIHLCEKNDASPYSSIVVVENDFKVPLSLDGLSETNQELLRQTRNFAGLGAATMGLLFMLPESVTNWNMDELKEKSLGERWKEKVSAGPVVDKDDWMINYIGHPLSGAAYYTVARHSGAGIMKSFGYSVLMSTFFWEYGLEAFAEVPSIQDLIITPLIGSLMGEGMYYLENKIRDNGGEVLGSKKLGAFAMGLMNPAGALLDLVNKPFESKIFKSSQISFTMVPPSNLHNREGQNDFNSYYMGLDIEFKF